MLQNSERPIAEMMKKYVVEPKVWYVTAVLEL
jgi:hypothetical protein